MSQTLDSPEARLEWARTQAGYADKAAFAKVAGVNATTYRAYENGQNGYAKLAGQFAKKLGVSAEWLLEGGPTPPISEVAHLHQAEEIDDDTVQIQHIDQAYGLGATFTDSPVEIELLRFPKVWVDSITNTSPVFLTWTRGRGDSMEPTIGDGDLILLDRSQRKVEEQDALWAFTVGDVGAIKRLRVKGDRFQIFSDNASVPPDEEPIDFVNIVGRVIFVGMRK
ncbi:XRE family transcriptional regulator [Sphingomonas immobilis]|uniref:S24 family peptidase n=1 Tax=Sphingomonas immobilis TaxID=3063997 RepID=A0ABT8ZU47_9SPHN|nr:S24 family peptidase [Sphingomonas sp. CA1-15]MDO7841106.1 S24 family peptidase [Sphingomonas sp. CA1-15]